jgi:hypothetical protein
MFKKMCNSLPGAGMKAHETQVFMAQQCLVR